MFGQVVERDPALSLGSIPPAAGDEPREPTVGLAVGRQQHDRRGIDRRDLGTDQELEAGLHSGRVCPDNTRQAVAVGDRQGVVAQLGRVAANNTKKFGGKRAAARGDVPFNQLQQAGQAVLPNVVPNSGTTDRALATFVLPAALGGSAYGANELGAPAPVVGTLGLLGAASTKKGNQAIQKLLVSRDPVMRDMGEKLLRWSRLGGMFGASAGLPALNQ